MGHKLFTLVCTAAFLALAFATGAAEVIDRVVATVNGHIILQSDWEDALRYEAFSTGRALDGLTAEDRKAALDGLIDQELLREQMRAIDAPHSSPEQVDQRITEIRKQYPGAASEPGWHEVLNRYGLSQEELQSRVAVELDLMSLVDSRIKELLTQKKITQLLTSWLKNLRAGSEIRAEALTAAPGGRSQ